MMPRVPAPRLGDAGRAETRRSGFQVQPVNRTTGRDGVHDTRTAGG